MRPQIQRRIRLGGRGRTGALIVEIEVVVPEHLTDDERKVFEKLRKEDTRDYRAEVNKYFAKF